MARGEVIEGQYLKIYKATSALLMRVVGMVLMILLIQWFKGWLFGWLFDLTGWSLMETLAEGTVLLMIMMGLLVIWGIYLFLKWRSSYYEIYPDRIVIRKGVIARRRDEIEMSQFGALSIDQGMMGRLFNYGNLRFATGSVGAVGRTLRQIPSPEHYLQVINGMLGRADRPETVRAVAQQPATVVPPKETVLTAQTMPTIETMAEQTAGVAQTMRGNTEMPMSGEVKIGNT